MNFPRRKKVAARRDADKRFRAVLNVCVTIGFLCVSTFYAERLPVKTYTIAEGLLRDSVSNIKQDSRGFLWFCTAEGVSRFDGYGFTNYTVADGLPDGNVNDFLEADDGTIYLATDKGLAKLNPKSVRGGNQSAALFAVIKPDNPKAKTAQVLYKDADGAMWVGTSDGIYRLNETGELFAVNLGESKNAVKEISVTAIVRDRRGALWIGTHGNGLFRLVADGGVSQFTTDEGMPGNFIASLIETKDGKLWAGMRWDGATAGLVLLNAGADETKENSIVERAFAVADGLPSNWIASMQETSDGKFWLGTIGGLCEWQGGNAKSICKNYKEENGLCDKEFWSLAEDKDGNLWTGSMCGAKKIARYGFTSYGAADGIDAGTINSIFENRNGELFASINKFGRAIYRFDDGKFSTVTPRLPPKLDVGWGGKQTAWQDSTGAWLVPTAGGLYRFAPETAFENLARTMPQKISPATRSEQIFRLFEDSRGDLWIATWRGASNNEIWHWRRETNVWEDLTARISATTKHIGTAFVEDRSGNLWIGTGADDNSPELIRYRNGEFKVFTETDNLPDGWIRDLYVDRSGRLWMANNKHGLLRLDDVNANELNLIHYSRAEGLSSAGAYCVVEDASGRIYVGSARGVDRLTPDTGQIENFTTADGLPSSFVELAHRDLNNNLWFGTANGLTKFVPEPTRRRNAPVSLITALRVNGEPQGVSILGETDIPKIELNAEQKQISIDFVGLGASLGEPLKYEYRLGDADWTRADARAVNFANLAAGEYEFAVRAATADGIYSRPATVRFHIAAPLYLQPWFLLLAALSAGALIFYAYRFRVQRLLEMERVRTRIATDLHDDIGANLTKISILSEVAHQRLGNGASDFDDGNLLENIAETSRESVSAMSDIVWAINPKKDSLGDLTRRMRRYAEDVLEQREISCEFDSTAMTDVRLDANVRRNVYLIFKEAVNNIVRHSRATAVRADFYVANNALVLLIEDDGAGFDQNAEFDGNGLASMRKRAAEMNGSLEIDSLPARGTKIVLRVELARAFWA